MQSTMYQFACTQVANVTYVEVTEIDATYGQTHPLVWSPATLDYAHSLAAKGFGVPVGQLVFKTGVTTKLGFPVALTYEARKQTELLPVLWMAHADIYAALDLQAGNAWAWLAPHMRGKADEPTATADAHADEPAADALGADIRRGADVEPQAASSLPEAGQVLGATNFTALPAYGADGFNEAYKAWRKEYPGAIAQYIEGTSNSSIVMLRWTAAPAE